MSLLSTGPALLAAVQSAIDRADIRAIIMWGTLLGHVRDRGFIAHDRDIDINIFPSDVPKIARLAREIGKFGLKIYFISPYLFRLYFVSEPQLWVDVWIFHEEGLDYTLGMKRSQGGFYQYRLARSLFEEEDEPVMFEGVPVRSPKQADRILELAYGDWRTPRPDFSDDDAPCSTILCHAPQPTLVFTRDELFTDWTSRLYADWARQPHPWDLFVRFTIGDPAPPFTQRMSTLQDFHFATVFGRYTVFCFYGSASSPGGLSAIDAVIRHRSLFDDRHMTFVGLCVELHEEAQARAMGEAPGVHFIWDFNGTVSRLYGAVDSTRSRGGPPKAFRQFWLILDPSGRVLSVLPFAILVH